MPFKDKEAQLAYNREQMRRRREQAKAGDVKQTEEPKPKEAVATVPQAALPQVALPQAAQKVSTPAPANPSAVKEPKKIGVTWLVTGSGILKDPESVYYGSKLQLDTKGWCLWELQSLYHGSRRAIIRRDETVIPPNTDLDVLEIMPEYTPFHLWRLILNLPPELAGGIHPPEPKSSYMQPELNFGKE